MDNTTEAAQILTRVFEALARQSGKTLNARTREDIQRACELLANAGGELEELLDDLPAPPRRSPAEAAIEADPGWQDFERWRNGR
jgi:acyl-CoA reductase-like NAD-dependent aldehyde dehydrogenase